MLTRTAVTWVSFPIRARRGNAAVLLGAARPPSTGGYIKAFLADVYIEISKQSFRYESKPVHWSIPL
ncbi:hypothetical protein BDW71DRAFT_190998 [Aspergillus fruticulosus]